MKKKILKQCLMIITALFCGLAAKAQDAPRAKENFDADWKFSLGHAADTEKDFQYLWGMALAKTGLGRGCAYGAVIVDFDDSTWRDIDLPHDWAVELPFMTDPKYFAQIPWRVLDHGYKPVGPYFPETSIGWYRKHFEIAQADTNKRISLIFDGAFRDSEVWVNGYRIGRHEGGYSGFRFDVTDYLNYGGSNVVAVRVDATKYEGWFYEGAGIYRHVWLEKTQPIHIAPYGLRVIADGAGKVAAQLTTVDSGAVAPKSLTGEVQIFDMNDTLIASANGPVSLGENVALPELTIPNPKLWSCETPNLYRYAVALTADGVLVDRKETSFGVRTIMFDAEKGFFLNGKRVQVKGACMHQDHAGVGSAVPDAVLEWRVQQLKKWGFNAYRPAHNPPAPELLDICDRLGVLVFNENRSIGSSPDVLRDLQHLVERDRNHPSVIAWSLGNEEPMGMTPQGWRFGASMRKLINELDGTRPISYGSNHGRSPRSTAVMEPGKLGGLTGHLDVFGVNYVKIGRNGADAIHRSHPEIPMWGSEEGSGYYRRGEYRSGVTAYDGRAAGWGKSAESWMQHYAARPWLAGAFLWTGFDYRGEPLPYKSWPHISSYFGALDTCGLPKDIAWYYKASWTDEPVLHIFPHWNWPGDEGKEITVWCYSNHEEVELFLNGKSLGRKPMPKLSHAAWKVKYAPGTLSAKAYDQGKLVQETSVATTGEPSALMGEPSKTELTADGRDCVIINVSIRDAQGRVVPTANLPVSFAASPNARILGVGNGDPVCHEPDIYIRQPSTARTLDLDWKVSETGEKNVSPRDTLLITNENVTVEFLSEISLTESDLAQIKTATLSIPRIDDQGTITVNGTVAGKSSSWKKPFSAEITQLLKAGKNVIEAQVSNKGGAGGLAKGAGIEIVPSSEAPQWKRTTYNGYCQVIVRAPKQPGPFSVKVESPGLKPHEIKFSSKD